MDRESQETFQIFGDKNYNNYNIQDKDRLEMKYCNWILVNMKLYKGYLR